MTKTTPTIIKVVVSSPVGVGEEGGTEVKPVVMMVGEERVAEGAVIVVEITGSPVGGEGDSGSPGIRVDDTIVAVILYVHKKIQRKYIDSVIILLTYTEANYRS